MRKYKFCLGVVIYNPSKEDIDNILKYYDYGIFEKISIYDNSKDRLDIHFINNSVFEYIHSGSNQGLSKPYNEIIKTSLLLGFDYLCLMDQDSIFRKEDINRIVFEIESDLDKDVAIYCPRVVTSRNSKLVSTKCDFVKWAINSGSFLNLQYFGDGKLQYDSNIFLDGVDVDMGLNIINAGYKIKRVNEAILEQQFGYKLSSDSTFTCHNAYRYFLIAHNRKYIFKKHYGLLCGSIFALAKNVYLCIRILIHEERKMKKISSCIKGIIN